jgi:NTP pyrophosphatase (non-canonical NTP hydrolase)
MKLNEYQEISKRTMPNKGFEMDVSNYCMGLAGETGEVVDLLKKVIHHGHPLTDEIKEKIHGEIGDVLHYTAGLATLLGFSLDSVATGNIMKLKNRYPDGFSQERSVNRND